MKKLIAVFLASLQIFSATVLFSGCSTTKGSTDLMNGIKPDMPKDDKENPLPVRQLSEEEKEQYTRAWTAQSEFSLKLLQGCIRTENRNVTVSPLSVYLALAMTANGAKGQTLTEMLSALGYEIPEQEAEKVLEEMNDSLGVLIAGLPKDKECSVRVADSIWFKDNEGLHINDEFLKTNAQYYDAGVFKSAFDDKTLRDINNWVKKNTDGMIDRILDRLDPQTVMCLINALTFEALWSTPYEKYSVADADFTTGNGEKRTVEMMYGTEYRYIGNDKAAGFIKDYKGGKYAFAALLPEDGITLDEFVNSLTAEELRGMLSEPSREKVETGLPKFTCDYSITLNRLLQDMGMTLAFGGDADLSGIGISDAGPLAISEVLHKAHIELSESGTKAAAVTAVIVNPTSAFDPEPPKRVILDRPFMYMIYDTETLLPVFTGTVTDIGK